MNSNLILATFFLLFVSCKADTLEIEIYASDVKSAASGDIIEVPLIATFSILGEDKDGDFGRVTAIARKYLGEDSEFKNSKGTFGDALVVRTKIPMGTESTLEPFLNTHSMPFSLVVNGSKVSFETTRHIVRLNEEIRDVNRMLSLDSNSRSTVIRLVGDSKEAPEVSAIAVFIDGKAELQIRKNLENRTSIEMEYMGDDASIYSQISPQFQVKFK